MNKSLCILEIIGLIILIIIPPALRIFVPKEKENEEEEIKLVVKALNCDGKEFITRTSYENDKVKMIVMKKVIEDTTETNPDENTNSNEGNNTENSGENNPPEEENNTDTTRENTNPDENITPPTEGSETPDNPKEEPNDDDNQNKFEAIFTRLSEDSRIARSDLEDGIVLTVDFSISAASDLNVGDLIKPINDQKIYYEDLGLVCSIIE